MIFLAGNVLVPELFHISICTIFSLAKHNLLSQTQGKDATNLPLPTVTQIISQEDSRLFSPSTRFQHWYPLSQIQRGLSCCKPSEHGHSWMASCLQHTGESGSTGHLLLHSQSRISKNTAPQMWQWLTKLTAWGRDQSSNTLQSSHPAAGKTPHCKSSLFSTIWTYWITGSAHPSTFLPRVSTHTPVPGLVWCFLNSLPIIETYFLVSRDSSSELYSKEFASVHWDLLAEVKDKLTLILFVSTTAFDVSQQINRWVSPSPYQHVHVGVLKLCHAVGNTTGTHFKTTGVGNAPCTCMGETAAAGAVLTGIPLRGLLGTLWTAMFCPVLPARKKHGNICISNPLSPSCQNREPLVRCYSTDSI